MLKVAREETGRSGFTRMSGVGCAVVAVGVTRGERNSSEWQEPSVGSLVRSLYADARCEVVRGRAQLVARIVYVAEQTHHERSRVG